MKSSTSRSIFSRARGVPGARGDGGLPDGAADEPHQRLDIAIQEEAPGVVRLKVDAAMNEVGILFRLCAVLYCYHWNIQSARIHTPGAGAISDEFVIATGENATTMNADSMRSLIDDLERLLFGGVSVLEYLTENEARISARERSGEAGTVNLLRQGEQSVIEVTAGDRPGLLLALSQAFYLMDINIFEAEITTQDDGSVWNRFIVDPKDKRFRSAEFQRRLQEELRALF